MTNIEQATVEQVVDAVMDKRSDANKNKEGGILSKIFENFKMTNNEAKKFLLSEENKEGGIFQKLEELKDFSFENLLKPLFNRDLVRLKAFLKNNRNNALMLGLLKRQIEQQQKFNIELAIQESRNNSAEAIQSNPIEIGEIASIYMKLQGEKPSQKSFSYAMRGYNKLKNDLGNTKYLTVVDYTKSRNDKRCYVINLDTKTVENCVQVGHGKKSGGEFASSFSDTSGSNKTSLGFYRTPTNITKANTKEWSGLLMKGIEDSNDQATNRGIYMHPGSVTGSEGCFTLPNQAQEIMKKLKGDSLLFAYYPDNNYLASSDLIKKGDNNIDYPQVT